MKGIDDSREGTYTVNTKRIEAPFNLKVSCNKAGHYCLATTDRVG